AEAVELARAAGTVVLFLGLGEDVESEGYDRTDMELPAAQERLLEDVLAVNDRVVVVLSTARRSGCRPPCAPCPPSSRPGCWDRQEARRPPTCSSAGSAPPASSPRPSRCTSWTSPRPSTSPASTVGSPTARASSSATGAWTPA